MEEMSYPTEGSSPVSQVPFSGSSTTPLFPPVCLKYHWDPSMVFQRIVPQGAPVPLALDPRPWTKVCLNYVNTGDSSERAPVPPPDMVFPSGGEFYPPNRYMEAIQNESLLRRLDRPLGTCDTNQFEPNLRGDMYVDGLLVPNRKQKMSQMVSEMSMPRALLRAGPYPCREEADRVDMGRSRDLFNNATKQQRYKQNFPTKKM